MNLAEAAAGLARKEVEKKQANEDIMRLESLTSKGAVALLKVNVIEVFGVSSASNMSFTFEVLPSEALYSDGDVVKLEKNVGEQVEFLLLSKDGKISVECTISGTEGEEEKKAYKGELMISEIPQDGEVRTDVSTDPISLTDGDTNNPTLKLKASIDDLSSVISSKRLELEQINQELKEISTQVQEVSRNKQDIAPKKKTQKLTKAKKVSYKDPPVPELKSSDKGSKASTVQLYLNDIAAKSWELGSIIVEKRAVKGEQFPHLIQLLPVMLRLDPFLSCYMLLIECIQGYYRRALITNKFYVGERYDDFEIDSDNNKRSPALPVGQAIEALQRYNSEYNDRMKVGRLQGKTPKKIEFDRAQSLKPIGIKEERAKMKVSVEVVTSHAREIVLGILADSGSQGLETLRCWIRELSLPKGLLYAYDDNGSEIEVNKLDEAPVYLKYNSTNNGDAYMKKNPSNDFTGVIFQPLLSSNVTEVNNNSPFYQFGNLPLSLFR